MENKKSMKNIMMMVGKISLPILVILVSVMTSMFINKSKIEEMDKRISENTKKIQDLENKMIAEQPENANIAEDVKPSEAISSAVESMSLGYATDPSTLQDQQGVLSSTKFDQLLSLDSNIQATKAMGDWSTVGNPDGTLMVTFTPKSGTNAPNVFTVKLDQSGKLMVEEKDDTNNALEQNNLNNNVQNPVQGTQPQVQNNLATQPQAQNTQQTAPALTPAPQLGLSQQATQAAPQQQYNTNQQPGL